MREIYIYDVDVVVTSWFPIESNYFPPKFHLSWKVCEHVYVHLYDLCTCMSVSTMCVMCMHVCKNVCVYVYIYMYMEPANLYNARESRQEENPRILHNGVTPLISRNSSVVVSLSAWQWRFAMVWHGTGCSLGTVDRPHLGPNSCRDMGGHQDVLLHGQQLHISNTHWNACRILGQRLWTSGIWKNIRTLFVGYTISVTRIQWPSKSNTKIQWHPYLS